MIDDKQSSIVRPKAVPPMFTPVLTPNTQSTTMNTGNRMPSQALVEMGMMIRKHDPEATRLHDCIGQVKVFAYNSIELRWENSPNIEGSLCAYERQQMINNKICPAFAFAIINREKSLIQPVTSDMAQHADKLRLFYEVARNGRREVFCLHFLTEAECLRLHTFLNRCIQALRTLMEQQVRAIPPVPAPIEPQTQMNGQVPPTMITTTLQQTPTHVYRQPMMMSNPTTPQFAARINVNRTPTRLAASAIPPVQPLPPPPPPLQQQHQQQQISYTPQVPIDLSSLNLNRITPTVPSAVMGPMELPKPIEPTPFPPSPIPLINGNNNNNTEDPTSSLKRLLNIRGQSDLENLSLDDGPVFPKGQTQQNLLDLMPPSAFEPITATPPSPVVAIGAERVKHRLSTQFTPTMTREHFRNVLLHLIQNDEHFLDIIYQACLTYPTSSSSQ